MDVPLSPQWWRNNDLLATIPKQECERLLTYMQYVELSFGNVLHKPGELITHVYFPHDSVISLVSAMENGSSAELAIVSSEGMVGLSVFLGSETATSEAVVQIPGSATKIESNLFRHEFCKSRLLTTLLRRYTHTLLTQTSQAAACNRLHHVQERFAKWLLLMHDRLKKDEFNLTHEIIAQMLGVRRAGLSTFAFRLRELGLIEYNRGHIRILNRGGLEAAACECYEIIKKEFERLQIAHLTETIATASASAYKASDIQVVEERERSLETLRDINSRLLIAGLREQEARDEAEEANRAKEEFLANVSHELRTPLSAMLGWSKVLRAGQLDKVTAAKALKTIERNVKSQQLLIESILDVSRITAGKLKLHTRPLNVRQIIEAALDTVRPTASAKGIQLHAAFDYESVFVFGDAQRLQQVFWNLLSNSIKFTPERGSVEIRLKRAGSYAQIEVNDTGKGITEQFLPHVFERFRQADTVSTAHAGLGLGLSIARHLVELHGGTIEAASQGEGMGATFTVNLPLMVTVLSRNSRGKKPTNLSVTVEPFDPLAVV